MPGSSRGREMRRREGEMFTGDASVSAPGAHLALALAPGASKKRIQRISISNLLQPDFIYFIIY